MKLFRLLPLLLSTLFLLLGAVLPVFAADPVASHSLINFDLQIPLPNVSLSAANFTSGDAIAVYINGIYQLAVRFAAILAVMFLVWGGVMWLTAGGDKSRVGAAEKIIGNALIGLILTLGSYVFLVTINPDIVQLKRVTPTGLTAVPLAQTARQGICCYQDGLNGTGGPLIKKMVNGAVPPSIYKRAVLTSKADCTKGLNQKRNSRTLVVNAPQFYCKALQPIDQPATPRLCWKNNDTANDEKSTQCETNFDDLMPPPSPPVSGTPTNNPQLTH